MTEELQATASREYPLIVCDRGISENGGHYWLYIAVKPDKYTEFICLLRKWRPVRFKEYGEILRYGYDVEVPESVRKEMKELYGCNNVSAGLVDQDTQPVSHTPQEKQDKKHLEKIVAMLKQKDSSV